MKHNQKKRKHKHHDSSSDSDDLSSSWSDGNGNTGNVCKKHICNGQKSSTYPSPIKTTNHINLTFFILNNTHLNDPAKGLGNLFADNTQSEITADWLDPKVRCLSQSVNPPLTGKEGGVTAVVAKAWYVVTENPVPKNLKPFIGHFTRNTVIKILLESGSDVDLQILEKGTANFPYMTRQVPNSWHTLDGNS